MNVLNSTLFLVWSFEWCAGGVFYGSSGERFSRIIKNVKVSQFLWFLFCSILDRRGAKTSAWFRVSLTKRGLENLTCGLHFSWIFISQIDRGEFLALEIFEAVFSLFLQVKQHPWPLWEDSSTISAPLPTCGRLKVILVPHIFYQLMGVMTQRTVW